MNDFYFKNGGVGRLVNISVAMLMASLGLVCSAQTLVSRVGSAELSPVGGNGDSWGSVSSPDGRFVAFASTADNLVTNESSGGLPLKQSSVPCINVYLRDRQAGTTKLVSVNTTGTGANGDWRWTNFTYALVPSLAASSFPAGISSDGRYVLFTSAAGNLVTPNDTNHVSDVFVRDMVLEQTSLVSAAIDGNSTRAGARNPSMSADGRYVAFVSAGTNLVPGVTNGVDAVYVRDLMGHRTMLASVPLAQSSCPSGASDYPMITRDGRYVVFYSTATNLVSGVPGKGDVFVRDLISFRTIWVSEGGRAALPASMQTNTVCTAPLVSDDGRYVAYIAAPAQGPGYVFRYDMKTGLTDLIDSNAVAGFDFSDDNAGHSLALSRDGARVAFVTADSTNSSCVKVWDATDGSSVIVSGNLSNTVEAGTIVDRPVFDSTGNRVAFLSSATDLVSKSVPGGPHLYVHDLGAGTTVLVDGNTNGANSVLSWLGSYSFGGNEIFFDSTDGTLVANDCNRRSDVFARDVLTWHVEMLSAHDPSSTSQTPNGPSMFSGNTTSADGRYIAFVSEGNNLVTNDVNGVRDVFVYDLALGHNILVSVNTNGTSASGPSYEPSISADGRYVAFTSSANDIAGSNGFAQVYVRDLVLGTTVRASAAGQNAPARGVSHAPQLSPDGRFLLFLSSDSTLGAVNESLCLRDLKSQQNTIFSRNPVASAQMTLDGRYVAYSASGLLQVWDTIAKSNVVSVAVGANFMLHPSGAFLVQLSAYGSFSVFSLTEKTWSSPTLIDSTRNVVFSADGSAMVALVGTAPSLKVVRYSLPNGSMKTVVSHSPYDDSASNRKPDSVAISPDGRYVAYRSTYTGTGDLYSQSIPNAVIVIYDCVTGAEQVVSSDHHALKSYYPRDMAFSADGSYLLFHTAEAELGAGDSNSTEDIYAATVTPRLYLDKFRYDPGDVARVQVNFLARNINPAIAETVRVRVQSGLDANGFDLTLTETTPDSGIFTALATGKDLGFTLGASDPVNNLIQVAEGVRFSVTYNYGTPGALTSIGLFSTNPPPVIVAQPANTLATYSKPFSLHVDVESVPQVTYQWYHISQPIAGATNNQLVITNATPQDGGPYSVIVSNYSGAVTSAIAMVTVGTAPTFGTQPVDQKIRAGWPVTFDATVWGTTPMLYQWWKRSTNDLPVSEWLGTTTFTIPRVQTTDAAGYYLVASNAFGVATSAVAKLQLTGDSPAFGRPQMRDRAFELPITGQTGITYQLLESTNLVDWTTNQVFECTTPDQTVTLPVRTEKVFYRLKEQ